MRVTERHAHGPGNERSALCSRGLVRTEEVWRIVSPGQGCVAENGRTRGVENCQSKAGARITAAEGRRVCSEGLSTARGKELLRSRAGKLEPLPRHRHGADFLACSQVEEPSGTTEAGSLPTRTALTPEDGAHVPRNPSLPGDRPRSHLVGPVPQERLWDRTVPHQSSSNQPRNRAAREGKGSRKDL